MLVGKIFEEVLKVDCCEVGVDEGEDDPVWEADLLHDLVHLPAQSSELLGEGTLLNWCIFSIFALEGKQTQMATVHGIGTLKTNTHVSTKFLSLVFGRQGWSIGRS